MGRILAIDYGTKRTGIAVSDPLRLIAGGLDTVDTKGLEAWLAKYFASEDVSTIVVGKPSRMDGTPSETWRFIEPLAVRLPVIMPSDRTAMQFALRTATDCDWSKGPRIVWLKNTLSLSEFYISEALIPDAEALDNVTVVSEPMDVIFDEEGNVKELR